MVRRADASFCEQAGATEAGGSAFLHRGLAGTEKEGHLVTGHDVEGHAHSEYPGKLALLVEGLFKHLAVEACDSCPEGEIGHSRPGGVESYQVTANLDHVREPCLWE